MIEAIVLIGTVVVLLSIFLSPNKYQHPPLPPQPISIATRPLPKHVIIEIKKRP